jgi:hypothetical protein
MKKNLKKGHESEKRAEKTGRKKSAILKYKSTGKKAAIPAPRNIAKLAKLQDELEKLSSSLIEEDIETLIHNARILIHNREVIDSVSKSRAARVGRTVKDMQVRIEEAADMSYFLIYLYDYQNFFAREEMKKAVKICHSAGNRDEAAMRLYNWFKAERLDVLKNSGFDSPGDPALGDLYDLIVQKYTVKS